MPRSLAHLILCRCARAGAAQNLALNSLEAAFIQLTGKAEAKGAFFPRMRERLQARGHKTADYDVCLRD